MNGRGAGGESQAGRGEHPGELRQSIPSEPSFADGIFQRIYLQGWGAIL